MTTIFKYLRESATRNGKAQELVTAAVKAKDYAALTGAAAEIDATYPVRKVDGKDENRLARNGLLSSLRMTLIRASKALQLPYVVRIKATEGSYHASEETPQSPNGEAGKASKVNADKLWAAVELTLEHLNDPVVLLAIKSALQKRASPSA